MAVHLSAASCADWAARQLGLHDTAALFALAESKGAGNANALFFPYLSGERTPHNDPGLRAAFLGLDHETGPADFAAAVLEGVAFALADGLDVQRDAGSDISNLSVIGGGARSRFWGTILASALGVPLVYRRGGEIGPALGAARLALIAVSGASPADVLRAPPVDHVVEPDSATADRLAPKRQRFRAAYPALRSI
jgi:xylulokinase